MNGTEEMRGRVLVAEVDHVAGSEEVGDRETAEDVDDGLGVLAADEPLDEGHEERGRHPDDAWYARRSQLVQHGPGLGREHQREMLVVAQPAGRRDHGQDEDVVERLAARDLGLQVVEELLELLDPQRLEQHVLAAGNSR